MNGLCQKNLLQIRWQWNFCHLVICFGFQRIPSLFQAGTKVYYKADFRTGIVRGPVQRLPLLVHARVIPLRTGSWDAGTLLWRLIRSIVGGNLRNNNVQRKPTSKVNSATRSPCSETQPNCEWWWGANASALSLRSIIFRSIGALWPWNH